MIDSTIMHYVSSDRFANDNCASFRRYLWYAISDKFPPDSRTDECHYLIKHVMQLQAYSRYYLNIQTVQSDVYKWKYKRIQGTIISRQFISRR